MTGAVFCRRLLRRADLGEAVAVVRGPMNLFVARKRIVMLDGDCYGGRTVKAWTVAAHEAAHAAQARRWGAWVIGLRVLMPVRLWLEWDANVRARRMMAVEGIVADEEVLRASWESYVWPAARQAVALAIVLAGTVARWGG